MLDINYSFNPCLTGILQYILLQNEDQRISFNPCLTGIYSFTRNK